MATVPSTFAERLDHVRSCVATACARAGRLPEDVTVVAVSKTKPVEALQAALESGVRDFGENRVQEAATKIPFLNAQGLRWHLIGHLQSNKVKSAVELFDVIHSVDSLPLAIRLNRLAKEHGKVMPVLLQVHLGDEVTKTGVLSDDLPALFCESSQCSHLRVEGLMAIPPFLAEPEAVRPFFRQLRELRDKLQQQFPEKPLLPHLSMGMSHDFEVAIEEGATMIRVGTALFGER